MKRYLIAIYLRLSKEDDRLKNQRFFNCESVTPAQIPQDVEKNRFVGQKEESNSIAMQRVLLRRYIEENFDSYEIAEFCEM